MKVGFISLGCSKNLVESEKMMGMLKSGNHTLVNDPAKAEAIIINTCGFIEPAKMEAINTILEMAEYKQEGSLKKLIVVGCLAQRYKEQLQQEMPEVDRFIGIGEYDRLHEILEFELGENLVSYNKSERLLSSKPWTAYMKVADGCSNCCTYCAIPLIRGGNHSFKMEDVLKEAKELEDKGIKELVVIAQDTTKYGLDLYGKLSLIDLLEKLNEMNFHWIRVLYMYPDEIDDRLIEGMTKLDKVIPYFDIPMQHANDDILVKMNRRGTKQDALNVVDKIRKAFKNPVLRTTFIVGFPTETIEQFEEMHEFVKEVKWDSMGAFTYSPEDDTPACEMDDQLEQEEKDRRLDILMTTQKEIALKNNEAKIGQVLEVLVESQDGLLGNYRGRSIYNAPDDVDGMVIFKSNRAIEFGSFVKVKITEAFPYDLKGVEVLD